VLLFLGTEPFMGSEAAPAGFTALDNSISKQYSHTSKGGGSIDMRITNNSNDRKRIYIFSIYTKRKENEQGDSNHLVCAGIVFAALILAGCQPAVPATPLGREVVVAEAPYRSASEPCTVKVGAPIMITGVGAAWE
jgi:hypothetical protein